VVEYRLRDGSGGRGRHRGGDGITRAIEVLAERVTVSLLTERRRHPPWGLAGGEAGAPGRNSLLLHAGDPRPLPSKATFEATRGEVIVVETPGGGGFGPPGVMSA